MAFAGAASTLSRLPRFVLPGAAPPGLKETGATQTVAKRLCGAAFFLGYSPQCPAQGSEGQFRECQLPPPPLFSSPAVKGSSSPLERGSSLLRLLQETRWRSPGPPSRNKSENQRVYNGCVKSSFRGRCKRAPWPGEEAITGITGEGD